MKQKSLLVTLLALTLAFGSLLAGCGSKNEEGAASPSAAPDSTASSSAASAAPKSTAPIKLEVIENSAALPAPDADPIKKELDKALNIDLNLTTYSSPDDYQNQLNVRVASNNVPDLFQIVNRQSLAQLSASGALLDLTPYADKLGDVKKLTGDDGLKKGYYNGKLYAVSKAPQGNYWTNWIRKDWLDHLNLPVPKTLDEYAAVAKAFTENDPDGNHKNDTFGITGGGGGGYESFGFNVGMSAVLSPIFGAFQVGLPGSIYVKDGKFTDAFHDPAMKDALNYTIKLFADKVVDPDIVTNSGTQHQQKAIQGQAGIVYASWADLSKDEFVEQIKTVNPNAQWIQLAAPQGPGGQFDGTINIGSTPMLFGISKSLEKNPEKLQKIFDLLNYVSVGDGANLVQFGVKGKHFNLDNGKVVPTDLLGKEGGYFWAYQFTGRNDATYLPVKFTKQTPYIEFANDQPRIEGLNGFVDVPQGYNPAEAERYFSEEMIKFIYGKRPMSEYDDFLNTLDNQFKYQVYLDAAQKQLQALGKVQ